MSNKAQKNANVKAHKNGKITISKRATQVHLDVALRNALAHVRNMSTAERRKSLIDAGIIKENGKLAPCYS
jgi:hypothetical protein